MKIKIMFLGIFLYSVIIGYVYSQDENNKVNCSFDNKVSFSVNIPDGWIAIENINPQKAICYNFYLKDYIYENPSIFISSYLLDESSDKELLMLVERLIENKYYKKIDHLYDLDFYIISYDIVYQDYSYSRSVFLRYLNYGYNIVLTTLYEKPDIELIKILDILINSLTFY
jgi:hypothetical protein